MKNTVTNAFRTKVLAIASLLCAGSLQAQFIDLSAADQKVKFTVVDVVNSNGDTISTTQGAVATVSTDGNGVITAKTAAFVQVSDGAGGTEQILTQELIIATPDGFGFFTVDKTTKRRTTPVLANGSLGTTTVVTTEDDSEDVAEGNLNLTPSSTFTPVNTQLEDPVIISQP